MALDKVFTKIDGELASLVALEKDIKNSNIFNKFADAKNDLSGFLMQLLVTLGELESFINGIHKFIGKGKKYENLLKKYIFQCFKTHVACNVNDKMTSLEAQFFTIPISAIDFFGILKLKESNKMVFGEKETDITSAIKHVINSGTPYVWQNLFEISYIPGSSPSIGIRIDAGYFNKPKIVFFSDMSEKIELLPNTRMLSTIIDNIFGSFSSSFNMDIGILRSDAEFKKLVEKMMVGGDDIEIDDSFFSFNNEELKSIEDDLIKKTTGIVKMVSCNNIGVSMSSGDIESLFLPLLSAGTYNEKIDVITRGFNEIENIISTKIPGNNRLKFKIDFNTSIFKELIFAFVKAVFSPGFLISLMLYFRLASKSLPSGGDIKEFLKQIKNIFQCIVKIIIKTLITTILIPIIIKEIKQRSLIEKGNRVKEKLLNYASQIQSLTVGKITDKLDGLL